MNTPDPLQPASETSPALAVRPLHQDNRASLLPLLNHWIDQRPYTTQFTPQSVDRDIFAPTPATIHRIKWQQNHQFGVWLGEDLIGFVDVATGFMPEMPLSSQVMGFLRFLALPWIQSHLSRIDEVGALLMVEAHRFWHKYGVRQVVAFDPRVGYPSFQAGSGVMPGEWSHHFRVLTEAGFQLDDRFYCLHRTNHHLLEETLPGLTLNLAPQGSDRDRHYGVYKRVERVAQARLLYQEVDFPGGINPVGALVHFDVESEWRGKGVERWLLRRIINDATLQGYRRIVHHIHPNNQLTINLFTQSGFQELDFRGYVFTKQLTP